MSRSETRETACGAARSCRARRVRQWDREDVKQRLFAGRGEGRFRLICSGDWPANETCFDAAVDRQHLYVSVMAQAAANLGLVQDGLRRDSDTVEVFLDPFGDRMGYLQFGAGSEGARFENSHWPYRDAKRNRHRDPSWDVTVEAEVQRPDVVRFFFFRFDLATVRGGDCIGFNVGRSQSRISENATWNLVSGIGFNDPGCFGRLWFRRPPVSYERAAATLRNSSGEDAPKAGMDGPAGRFLESLALHGLRAAGKTAKLAARLFDPAGRVLAEWKNRQPVDPLRLKPKTPLRLDESGRFRVVLSATAGGKPIAVQPGTFFFDSCRPGRRFQLQGTYDWPDNFGNVVYTPKDLEREMQWYADAGLERFYWLDYAAETWMSKRGRHPQRWAVNIGKSYAVFGGDFLRMACRAAHQAGREFVTIFKPFDLSTEEPFIARHPEYCIRRNPAWVKDASAPITTIRLYQADDTPFPFRLSDVRLWQSRDNRTYRPVRARKKVRERVLSRPEAVWSPRGVPVPSPRAGVRRVRCLSIEGLSLDTPFLAVMARRCDPTGLIRNREYLLAEVEDAAGRAVPHLVRAAEEIPAGGFAFGPRGHNAPSWSRADDGVERLIRFCGRSLAVGLSRRLDRHLPGFLEPCFSEVRAFWLDRIGRGLRAGADAVSVRIAHHVGCVDWLAHAYAEPVLEAFRARTGREPEPSNRDAALLRRIRGEAYTQFVREASAMARKAGRGFIHHVENRMLMPPELDCYCQIHWDWGTWIREGLVDEVDLKYIGPDHPDCYEEIVPLARRHGVRVNWISADPEPRSKPRSIREAPLLVDRARSAGLDGVNLYELWLYRRMTDRGVAMTRGSGEAIIREMRRRIDEERPPFASELLGGRGEPNP